MPELKISIHQTSPSVGDFDGNFEIIKSAYEQSLANDCDIAVFAEGTVHGYYAFDLLQSKDFLQSCENTIQKIAELTTGNKTAIIVGSATLSNSTKSFNSVVVLMNGKIVYTNHKNAMADEGACIDSREFKSGDLNKPFEINGVKIALPICNDIWEQDVCKVAVQGSDLAISINASPYNYGKLTLRHDVVKQRIDDFKIPFIYTHDVGGYDGVLNDGGSFAINTDKSLAMQLPQFETATSTIEYKDGVLSSNTNTPIAETDENFAPTIWNACCFGLKEYVRKNGFNGVVLGLSGGVDSAITATMAVDALGAENVHTVMMPSPYTSQESLIDAKALVDNLGINYETINIEPMMNAFNESFSAIMQGTEKDTTEENIQARIRGSIVMALSNKFGYLALTTGNKSENAVGYATLYGDMCGGFNLIKDIYKTDVFKLCHWRNKSGEVIPQNIISKPPTAELRENQTDQDSLPEYDILDGILKCLIENRMSINDTVKQGYDKDTVKKIWKLLNLAEYKRQQSAVGLKLTSCDFSYDRLYPISNSYTWHELKKDD
ncbi:MAG: NAD+ synthase [Alphaproteobacteria bacterium]